MMAIIGYRSAAQGKLFVDQLAFGVQPAQLKRVADGLLASAFDRLGRTQEALFR
jgi:hypothetical protein